MYPSDTARLRSGEHATSDPTPTTEPFATCVAALCRHVDHPEVALTKALQKIAQERSMQPQHILDEEARRHGFHSSTAFRHALIPAIQKRRREIDAHDIFCDKNIDYAR